MNLPDSPDSVFNMWIRPVHGHADTEMCGHLWGRKYGGAPSKTQRDHNMQFLHLRTPQGGPENVPAISGAQDYIYSPFSVLWIHYVFIYEKYLFLYGNHLQNISIGLLPNDYLKFISHR